MEIPPAPGFGSLEQIRSNLIINHKPDADLIAHLIEARQLLTNIWDANRAIIEKNSDIQSNQELAFIFKTPVCSFNGHNRLNLTNLNHGALSKLLRENFYNPGFMQLLHCIFDSIVLSYPGDTDYRARIKHWIQKLDLVGTGALGEVYQANLRKSLAQDFVIKVQNGESNIDPIHELFIGLFGTNLLRDQGNLNFSYVFGGFSCSHPIRKPHTAGPVAWCNAESAVQYNIYEKVTGPALNGYLQKCSANEFLQYLVQITLSLSAAYKKIGFTHYDLHTNNIILRVLPKPRQLHYSAMIGQKVTDIFITTNIIATIIDFGLSYINYQNENFGSIIGFKEGVSEQTPFPMFDIFKLLVYSFVAANASLKVFIRNCLQFFTPIPVESILSNKVASVYFLPMVEPFTNLSYDDFWTFLDQNFAEHMTWLSTTPTDVLDCNYINCASIEELEKSLISSAIPTDPFEFYDYVNYNKFLGIDVKTALTQYSVQNGLDLLYNKYQSLDEKYADLVISQVQINMQAIDELMVEMYINYLLQVAKLINIVNDVELLSKINTFFRTNFNRRLQVDWVLLFKAQQLLKAHLQKIKRDAELIQALKGNGIVAPLQKMLFWFSDLFTLAVL